MKKAGVLLLCLVCVLFSFTGCRDLSLDVEGLIQAPQLTGEQKDIYQALQAAVGSNITLKYPKTGDYRSAFVFWDIDGDGTQEVLVFYENAGDTEQNARVNVLACRNGRWASVCDVAGFGREVDRVQFDANVSGQGQCDIVIGWMYENTSSKSLGVYSFEENMLKTRTTADYSSFSVLDFDGDGLNELLVLTSDYSNMTSNARILEYVQQEGREGSIIETSSCALSTGITQFKQMLEGILVTGQKAVFVDSVLSSGLMTTELLVLRDGQLTNLLQNSSGTPYVQRTSDKLSQDINNDGFIEIPQDQLFPGYEEVSENERIYLTRWLLYDAEQTQVVSNMFYNAEEHYYFVLPQEWVGRVTVSFSEENHEYRFYEYSSEGTSDERELLRIRTYVQNEYFNGEQMSQYTLVDNYGTAQYYIMVPPTSQSTLKIELEQAISRFAIL